MDQSYIKLEIHKATLIRKNNSPIQDVYQFNPQTDKLGQGAYGTVYKCVHKQTHQVRAVKVINKNHVNNKERLVHEITIMELMDHPNILKLFETFEDEENLYMLIDENRLCGGGDVFDKVLEKGFLEPKDALILFVQYMRAVLYYQRYHIVHRDLKPENFLFLDKKNMQTLTVIDFGIAKKCKSTRLTTKTGTAYYVAPEVLDGDYDEKCDLWSAGVILYVLLCGYPPFYGDNEKEILMEIKQGNLVFEGDEWNTVDQSIKDFITLMIAKPKERKPAKELLEHKLIQEFIQINLGYSKQMLTSKKLRKWVQFPCLKRTALLYLATQLDYLQLANYKASFFFINKSQSGLISPEELDNYFIKEIPKYELSHLFKMIDSNNNGLIDYFEFVSVALEVQLYTQLENMQNIFKFLADYQKTITKESLKRLMDDNFNLATKWDSIAHVPNNQKVITEFKISKNVPDIKMAEQIIKEVDLDKDGQVSFDEFKSMMLNDLE